MRGIQALEYEASRKDLWDGFAARAKNGTFLILRDYMEYHADRFSDRSVLFIENGEPIALFPANVADGTVVSHGGLTFGGIISDTRMTVSRMLSVFDSLLEGFGKSGINRLVYKAIPHIYHAIPAEEDLYALFVHNATLCRRDVSSTIFMEERPPFRNSRRSQIKRAKVGDVRVAQSLDFTTFMTMQEQVLRSRFGVKPVHTGDEMERLATKFCDNIRLFVATRNERMIGGAIIYENRTIAHTQYISATDEGKELGALDLVFDYLINHFYVGKRFFDFGVSTTEEGRSLNEGLIQNKESYGARAVIHDFYEVHF
jgi:hypothetical protein